MLLPFCLFGITSSAITHRYQYDANHNIDSISDLITPAKNISLTYDDLDRLDTAAGFWGNGSFAYDVLGNITAKTLGSQSLTYAYNSNNRLTGVGGSIGRSFAYDSRGNITNNGQRAFSFNLANQLITSGTNSYQYDGYNRRVKKTSNGKTQYSLYNAAGQLLMTDGDNGPTEYFYLGTKLIAKESQVPTSEDTPGYTGHLEDDDLQLTYMQQRYYDPIIGRFYSNDPVGFTVGKPMMFNRYAYANNNPYKFVDPDGREPFNFQWISQAQNPSTTLFSQSQAAQFNQTASNVSNVSNGMAAVAPHNPAGVLLGVVGAVASVTASLTGVGTPVGAAGLFFSLDGIRSSWTGGRTLTGMALEAGATRAGMSQSQIDSVGRLGDFAQGTISGGGTAVSNTIKGVGNVGDAAGTVSQIKDTADVVTSYSFFKVDNRMSRANLN